MASLHIEVTGTGSNLVLLHGWGLNVRVWDGIVAALRDRFRLIAVDLPGHGQSAWTASGISVAETAGSIGHALASVSNRYSLLGWSLGGQIALEMAAADPDRIEHLILVATTARFITGPDWPHGMPNAAITKMAAQLQIDYQRAVSDFLELQVRGSADAAEVLERLRNALFVHGPAKPEALVAGLETLATGDLRPLLARVLAPTLVIAGQYDRITPPSAARALAEALPNGRFVEMARAAHAPFLSHPAEFAQWTSGFLTTPPRAVRPEGQQSSHFNQRIPKESGNAQ